MEALEAKASGLQKDLIAAIDALNTSEEQIKVLTEQLEFERQSMKQKDKLFATTAQRMKVAVAKALTTSRTQTNITLYCFSGISKASKF